ncbi:hypothetical protein IRJ34_07190 [Paenarthrobacter sp. GOM3]|uniref:hypothetical protein n=1 Tax=Paenarthrobacter sp. GOM3 TaxID=2782567 RepID=UPI001BA5EA51|nr:hypothetical protein [Paenarthrobacter sp. GOM3]WOH20100.1 hypothetical protein IRJ34_07190 [Paenarthrobacter sp. GOM3]
MQTTLTARPATAAADEWPYATEQSPQFLAWGNALATAEHQLAAAQAKLDALPKPSPAPEDPAAINIASGARWGRLGRDAERAEKIVKAQADVARLQNQLEYMKKRKPIAFTKDELDAARVIRSEMGWEVVARVNGTTVTVGHGTTQARVPFTKVLEVRA